MGIGIMLNYSGETSPRNLKCKLNIIRHHKLDRTKSMTLPLDYYKYTCLRYHFYQLLFLKSILFMDGNNNNNKQ